MSVAAASPVRYSHSIGVLGHGGRGFQQSCRRIALRPPDGRDVRRQPLEPDARGHPGGPANRAIVRVRRSGVPGRFWIVLGPEDGQFYWMTAIALDTSENIYVTDELPPRRPGVRSWTGRFLPEVGAHSAAAPEQFNRPSRGWPSRRTTSSTSVGPPEPAHPEADAKRRGDRRLGQPGRRGLVGSSCPGAIAVGRGRALSTSPDWGNDRISEAQPGWDPPRDVWGRPGLRRWPG